MPPTDWAEVTRLCTQLGYASQDVRELVVEPWGITVTSYQYGPDGAFLLHDGHIATVVRHFPRLPPSGTAF